MNIRLPGFKWIKYRSKRTSILITIVSKTVLIAVSVMVFVLALIFMKEGAEPLAPVIRNHFSVNSPASALGFGWMAAGIALSGSPVAATSLALLDARVLSPLEAFAMIGGSRLGAAFIVLLIGFIYILRGKPRELSLGVGLLSLLVTQTLYIPVLALGFFLLTRSWLPGMQIQAQNTINSPFARLFDPLIVFIERILPAWTLFPIGFLLIISSLWLFDRVLPNLHLDETNLGMLHHLLYRPFVTFMLGAAITALTMSVSVSLSLLVPLSVRGYVRRENVIPYIMGANITTFIDTLIAAAMLTNPAAITIVLVQIVCVTFVSLIIILFFFDYYELILNRIVKGISKQLTYLAVYTFITFLVPLILLVFF